jgi:dipeptidyl aminopeptidase/acylaminoacyl peptidase
MDRGIAMTTITIRSSTLANRGMRVLQVNYRGSTGFGLKFLNAGTNVSGVAVRNRICSTQCNGQWNEKIADPAIALGWSGGGFATLLALE